MKGGNREVKITTEDKQHIINCVVRATFAKAAADPSTPTEVIVSLSNGETLTFEKAHWILRGYKCVIPGIGLVMILEQNPAKTGSWCGHLAAKYGIKLAWLFLNNKYNRCLIDLDEDDILYFDASGDSPTATRDEVKAHPQIRAIIERVDANREAQLRANKEVKHFE
jgi:hypothetical protein